jgi:hypothetical protein
MRGTEGVEGLIERGEEGAGQVFAPGGATSHPRQPVRQTRGRRPYRRRGHMTEAGGRNEEARVFPAAAHLYM